MGKLSSAESKKLKSEIHVIYVQDFNTIPDGSYYSIITQGGGITGLFKRNASEEELTTSPHLNKEPNNFYSVYCAGDQECLEQNYAVMGSSRFQVFDYRPGYIVWNPVMVNSLKNLMEDIAGYVERLKEEEEEEEESNDLPFLGSIKMHLPVHERITWLFESHFTFISNCPTACLGKVGFYVSEALDKYVEEYTGVKIVVERIYSAERMGHLVGDMRVEETEHGGLKITTAFESDVLVICELRFPEEIADNLLATKRRIEASHVVSTIHCVYLDLIG